MVKIKIDSSARSDLNVHKTAKVLDHPDGSVTTEKLSADIQTLIGAAGSAENHRNILRCKNLGTEVTDTQKTAILNGTFDDLFLGDYWNIGGYTWRIVDMDYWCNTFCDGENFTSHHLVIMPDGILYPGQMNDTNTTAGGYIGSKMYTEGLNDAKNTINAIFGDMVIARDEVFINAVKDGKPSGTIIQKSTIELPSEFMMFGTDVLSPKLDCATAGYHTGKIGQLALFKIAPEFRIVTDVSEAYVLLRDVVSSTHFAAVGERGDAISLSASIEGWVRPVFAIGHNTYMEW